MLEISRGTTVPNFYGSVEPTGKISLSEISGVKIWGTKSALKPRLTFRPMQYACSTRRGGNKTRLPICGFAQHLNRLLSAVPARGDEIFALSPASLPPIS